MNIPMEGTATRENVLLTSDLPDIALFGGMGSGKTTAADYLVERFGYKRLSFADAVRDVAARVYGEDARRDRQKLNEIGQGLRAIDPDIWVKAFFTSYELAAAEDEAPVVVDDMRLPNEYEAVKAEDFRLVRVAAEEELRINRLKASGKWQGDAQLSTVTETSLHGFHAEHLVFNQSTRDVLQNQLIEVLYKEARSR